MKRTKRLEYSTWGRSGAGQQGFGVSSCMMKSGWSCCDIFAKLVAEAFLEGSGVGRFLSSGVGRMMKMVCLSRRYKNAVQYQSSTSLLQFRMIDRRSSSDEYIQIPCGISRHMLQMNNCLYRCGFNTPAC